MKNINKTGLVDANNKKIKVGDKLNLKTKTIVQKPLKLWCGFLPDIHGYGLVVFERTEVECKKTLKKEFYKMKKVWHGEFTYLQAMDNFGGNIFQIETGKAYDDGLR